MPDWVPASWVYVGFGTAGLWRRLNTGDRIFLICIILFGLALPLGLGGRFVGHLASTFPDLMPLCAGAYGFALVALLLNMPMIGVRSHRFHRFMPETTARRRRRIGLEFGMSAIASLVIVAAMLSPFLTQQSMRPIFTAAVVAIGLQALWHAMQLICGDLSLWRTGQSQVADVPSRSRLSAALIGGVGKRHLPETSSRFLLKSISNPLVWIVLILMTLVLGGAIVSTQYPFLWTLSGLSTLLMIVQFSLMEPRLGNGVVLGAHSVNMPIHRGISDLFALSLPHLFLLVIAFVALILAQNWVGLAVALAQAIATVWALWLGLVIKALPPRETTKHALWAIAGGMIAGQVFPPLIIVLALAITVALTRELMALTQKGPALWPRP
jgi:hypothetical protein